VIDLRQGDCLEVLKQLDGDSVDSIVTDPPYGLSFMGRKWDYDVPSKEIWEECLRVLKPGGHLLAFAGTRTQHRMCVNIEDAGFEIRDMIAWVYGSGFPKSMNVGKAIDSKLTTGRSDSVALRIRDGRTPGTVGTNMNKHRSAHNDKLEGLKAAPLHTTEAQQWDGWGTALKPALEPITVARKPFKGTVANNVLTHGTGAINIDGCRVGTEKIKWQKRGKYVSYAKTTFEDRTGEVNEGRWPANLIHDGSDDVVRLFPETSPSPKTTKPKNSNAPQTTNAYGSYSDIDRVINVHGDSGSAARFFYCAKASKKDRGEGNNHPTVKPTDLMAYLCRLVTPPGGIILDPFMGSGSTGKAAMREGFSFIGIEREAEYYAIAQQRVQVVEDPQPKLDLAV